MRPLCAIAAAPWRGFCNWYSPSFWRMIDAGLAGGDSAAVAVAMPANARRKRNTKAGIGREALPRLRARRKEHAFDILQKHARAFVLKTMAFDGELALHAGD